MPSAARNWFARHCAPPPPLTNTPVCPCTTCFNGGSHTNNSASFSVTTSTERRRADSETSSISSGTTVTTVSHIETTKQ
ncbi:hypothetical protein FSOLCH5_014949 [Fusarium solani]|uniref:uncharacterized protein n=1 Tax=Fusarium solani TaxID=169388 RepID=UPI002214DEA6|nr:hypothetical protein NCS56_00678100 [Fusarium sp. Ph1]KAJ3462529.1 hypothetical protein MRS44_007315 [Fusarium solani]KAJ4215429.1 hypothetical protein NW759_009845 [Fusarium solani]